MIRSRVLLAEDDAVVAIDLASELEAAGMVVSGMASSLAGTLELIDAATPDIALLNVRLRDGVSFPAARRLKALNVPFAFLTSFERSEIAPEFRDIPRLSKPQVSSVIAEIVRHLAETRLAPTRTRCPDDINPAGHTR